MNLRRLSRITLAFALLASACEFGFGPGDVEGRRYVLESVSSVALPATISGAGWSYRLVADTIWFDDDARGRQVHVQEWNGQPRERYEQRFMYEFNDGRLEVTYVCPPNASCIEGPHLIVERRHQALLATYPPGMQGQGNPQFFFRRDNRD